MNDHTLLPQVNIPANMIHLGLGQPTNSLLPLNDIKNAAAHALSVNNPFFLAYGKEQGNINFRETLAQFLTGQYAYTVGPDQLLITNGNSQALDFICTHFTHPGDTVFVEEPSYFLALKIFVDRKLNIVGIPMDGYGLDIDALKKFLNSKKPTFVYTIPAYHNPASVTLSLQRREELVRICSENNILLVADEVYHCLSYTEKPPPSMGYWADQCLLISLGSFSKILAPGLRLGWMQANSKLIQKLSKAGILESGGGFNPFTSEIVNSVIRSGILTTHINRLKDVYRQRIEVFVEQSTKSFPEQVVFQYPSGGYFIWVELPDYIDTKFLRQAAKTDNVDFLPGSFFSSKNRLKNYIRLSFAFYPKEILREGIKRLGNILLKHLS
ncbi:PLP-dependent aminotransferase family protein [Desulfobacula sp.]|uniref:aminotransferase-like domain-containing protein n=1 Tax=Desulfobacula sp. TaxID=2593537 RepID=UPI0025C155C2|nr:PLP-dependent aminotransferase family protein [Desulfobacula sp.]MBC2703480.1 PLP-dependent aminotransferase family protein [Desulfobacula sp.]